MIVFAFSLLEFVQPKDKNIKFIPTSMFEEDKRFNMVPISVHLLVPHFNPLSLSVNPVD